MGYQLVDSGNGEKLERFGEILLARPCAQALWRPRLSRKEWEKVDARFSREGVRGWKGRIPSEWEVVIEGVRFKLAPTDFGHLGVFPEHSLLWKGMCEMLKLRKAPRMLNLFAYSGGATLAAAQVGAEVCHVDASSGMVKWARENAALNGLQEAKVRWIVDDVLKFLQREVRRGVRYDGILLDPPSFGRGKRQEVFKIEEDLHLVLDLCVELLSDQPLFLVATTHTPGMTPLVMHHLLRQKRGGGILETGEMILPSEWGTPVPCGSFALWRGE